MDGIQYTLTRSQFHLLHLLAAYEGQLVSHSEIIQIIDKERDGKPATLTESSNYMRNLRKKLCLDSETSRYILKSVKRRGYLLIDRQEMNWPIQKHKIGSTCRDKGWLNRCWAPSLSPPALARQKTLFIIQRTGSAHHGENRNCPNRFWYGMLYLYLGQISPGRRLLPWVPWGLWRLVHILNT